MPVLVVIATAAARAAVVDTLNGLISATLMVEEVEVVIYLDSSNILQSCFYATHYLPHLHRGFGRPDGTSW